MGLNRENTYLKLECLIVQLFYPSTNIVSNPDLACYHLCLSNLEWKILPKSILGHKACKLFPQAILVFVISL